MKKKWIWIILLAPLAIALFIAIGGGSVMLLWNWLLPTLFGWRQISFWQALGLLALCRILFGGLGVRGSHRSSIRRRMDERIRQRMDERWEKMTPEEREKYRQGFQGRCWPFEPPDAKPTG
jgi:membrane protein implicated in regulation of membrane protease activity